MDQESIVYGCIKDLTHREGDAERRRTNRLAMLTLPSAEEWPYLCKEMFSIPSLEANADSHTNGYQTEVIHFGSSYKAIEHEWKQWMAKFEELLSKMYWVSAVVHLETELNGVHTFTWESKRNEHRPGMGAHSVSCEWTQENSFV